MEILNKSKNSYYGKIIWLYTKYQLLTKTLLFFIIFPIFNFIVSKLLLSTGRVSISSGDYLGFIFSIHGLGLLILTFMLLTLLIGIDINAFIVISSLIRENRIKFSVRALWLIGIKSLKLFLRPVGMLVMIYIAIVVPLVGVGLGVSVTKNFKIPNFITDVIFNNTLYKIAYIKAILILTIVTIMYIFFFHYLIIDNQPIEVSLKNHII